LRLAHRAGGVPRVGRALVSEVAAVVPCELAAAGGRPASCRQRAAPTMYRKLLVPPDGSRRGGPALTARNTPSHSGG
jgi:hypothetical protein